MTRSGEAGFSLVEMLVSLALLSLMTIYALNALSSLKRFNGVAARLDAQAEVDAAAAYMEEELSGAALRFRYDENRNAALLFEGSPASITFITSADGRRETGGLYMVSYTVDAQQNLVSRRALLQADAQGPAQDVIVLRNVSRIEFSYAGKDGNFASAWPSKERLPQSVKINVTWPEADDRKWPQLMARIATAN